MTDNNYFSITVYLPNSYGSSDVPFPPATLVLGFKVNATTKFASLEESLIRELT